MDQPLWYVVLVGAVVIGGLWLLALAALAGGVVEPATEPPPDDPRERHGAEVWQGED